ncbi:3-keto-5-aminohexanoate cleavage protein [soil metagenome]
MPTLLDALTAPAPVVLAPTGMVPTREQTPHVPLTPAEVAADVAACWQVGITSVHLHARDEAGAPTWRRDIYERLVGAVRERTPEVLINVSTSGRTWSELERRADVLALDGDLAPDIASLTPSSLNFLTSASINAPDVVRGLARIMRERGITPEFELFDLGMISMMKRLVVEELAAEPVLVNLFFGNLAGLQPTPMEVGIAVERLPAGAIWSGAGLGDYQGVAQLLSVASGGGVRTGIEDSIHPHGTRERLATNLELVEQVQGMLTAAGRRMMTSAELRERLR